VKPAFLKDTIEGQEEKSRKAHLFCQKILTAGSEVGILEGKNGRTRQEKWEGDLDSWERSDVSLDESEGFWK
jgi:hypothetical protein